MNFADGYGQWLDRKEVCFSKSASVVVMITDTCPCHYPDNYVSNKRWCCGDMYHLDLSVWAYEKVSWQQVYVGGWDEVGLGPKFLGGKEGMCTAAAVLAQAGGNVVESAAGRHSYSTVQLSL
jgi:hypothetical protein